MVKIRQGREEKAPWCLYLEQNLCPICASQSVWLMSPSIPAYWLSAMNRVGFSHLNPICRHGSFPCKFPERSLRWDPWTLIWSLFVLGPKHESYQAASAQRTAAVITKLPPMYSDMDEVTEILPARVCVPGSPLLIKNILLSMSLIHITTFFGITKRITNIFIHIIPERNLECFA